MSRFVLITSDPVFGHHVDTAVAGGLRGDVQTIAETVLPESPGDLLEQLDELPEVIVFGPGVERDDALRLVAILDVQFPEISLVLVAEEDSGLALAAMRAGIRDILPLGAENEEICVLLERACNAAASRRRGMVSEATGGEPHGRVIAVASPKGGIGKTTVAANLAVGLGRLAPMETVIVDLDAQFGDIATVLRVQPEHTLWDAVTGAAASDNMVLKAFLSVHSASIYVLCAPNEPSQSDEITGAQVENLLRQLAGEFRFVVVDTAPGLGEHALAAVEQSTDLVMVSGMDVPSVRAVRKELDILTQLDLLPERRHVVVNMADRHSGLSIPDIEATIGVPVDVRIPRSRAVTYATNKGEPLLAEAKSRDAAAGGLRELVKRFGPGRMGLRRRIVQKVAVRK